MTELSYALAILSSVTYGAADFLGGLASRRSSMFAVVVWSQLTGLILVLIALPLLPPASPARMDFVWGAASGLAGGIGVALLYRGLTVGMMSVIAPVTAVCAVIIPLVAGILFGERPSLLAFGGVALGIAAIVLVSQSEHVEEGKTATSGLGIAIVSGVAIGIFLVLLERTGSNAGLWPLVAARIVSVGFFAILGLTIGRTIVPRRESMKIVIAGGALDMAANIFYLLAVRQGLLSIVATLTSLYPASTIVLARIVLGERLRWVQQCGVACAVLAIVLIVRG